MVIKTEEIKDLCAKILSAVDASNLNGTSDKLKLHTEDNMLYMSVTNNKYFVKAKYPLPKKEKFFAVIEAVPFLKLISKTTVDTFELTSTDSSLVYDGNGHYNIPLENADITDIVINNKTSEFDVETSILNSILTYNSKELNKSVVIKQVQMLYYVDEQGAITFTSGACVNKFTLASPIKILFDAPVVKLFKLFNGEKVKFSVGYDALSEDLVQTKASFEDDNISLTAILSSNDALINSVPEAAIRDRAYKDYPYTVSINREATLQAIDRLMLFTSVGAASYGKFVFGENEVRISVNKGSNEEPVPYTTTSNIADSYTATLDLKDIKLTLEACTEQDVVVSFGDKAALVISRGNIYNVIPEAVIA